MTAVQRQKVAETGFETCRDIFDAKRAGFTEAEAWKAEKPKRSSQNQLCIQLHFPCSQCGFTDAVVSLKADDGSTVTCGGCGHQHGELREVRQRMLAMAREDARFQSKADLSEQADLAPDSPRRPPLVKPEE